MRQPRGPNHGVYHCAMRLLTESSLSSASLPEGGGAARGGGSGRRVAQRVGRSSDRRCVAEDLAMYAERAATLKTNIAARLGPGGGQSVGQRVSSACEQRSSWQ